MSAVDQPIGQAGAEESINVGRLGVIQLAHEPGAARAEGRVLTVTCERAQFAAKLPEGAQSDFVVALTTKLDLSPTRLRSW